MLALIKFYIKNIAHMIFKTFNGKLPYSKCSGERKRCTVNCKSQTNQWAGCDGV